MKFYMAPLHGVTDKDYRQLFDKYFDGVDKYFIPFINPSSKGITNKEKREVSGQNNRLKGKVVPQIISKNAEDTINLICYLQKLGYDEINLNFGCPSATVVSKGKGCGMLKDVHYMDEYLNKIFSSCNVKISIKIRLGLEDENEFESIISVLNKYDIEELIIHPRTMKDQYSSSLHLSYFKKVKDMVKMDIIYNGDILTEEDIDYIENSFPFIKGIMIGRGLICNPSLLSDFSEEERLNKVRLFYKDLSLINIETYGWNNAKFYLKGIWACMINFFDADASLRKKLFKEEKEDKFNFLAEEILAKGMNTNKENGIKGKYE